MSAPAALMAATVSSTGLPALAPPPQMLKAMTVSVVPCAHAAPLIPRSAAKASAVLDPIIAWSPHLAISQPIAGADYKAMTVSRQSHAGGCDEAAECGMPTDSADSARHRHGRPGPLRIHGARGRFRARGARRVRPADAVRQAHLLLAAYPGECRPRRQARPRRLLPSSGAGRRQPGHGLSGPSHRRARRHARAHQGRAHRCIAVDPGDLGPAGARHLARHLPVRAPHASAPPRGGAASDQGGMRGMNELAGGPVQGVVADGFEPVAEEFARNFTERGEVGAAFAVVRQGEVIVDLHGGSAAPGKPWNRDTLQVIFSGTKGLVAMCILMLVDRGALDLERPVAHYWPEFAAAGKGRLLVRDIVCHRSGLPGITGAALGADDVVDDVAMEARLAAQPLSPDQNPYRCYHALTIGWLCGGVLRRIDGRSIGRFFADEIAGPLGLDIWIGLPEALVARVGRLELVPDWQPWDAGLTPAQAADPTRRSVWANPPLFPQELPWNAGASHASEIPGGGAIATALSMARLYACLANGGELDGVRLMSAATLAAGRRELNRFVDPFILEPMSFGTVFALQTEQASFGPPADAFGHSGAGGSIHGAWPSQGLGLSYVMNQLRADPERVRTRSLFNTLYSLVAAG